MLANKNINIYKKYEVYRPRNLESVQRGLKYCHTAGYSRGTG